MESEYVIKQVTTESKEMVDARTLFAEYVQELNEDLAFQSLETELQNPLTKYGPPMGSLFMLYVNEQPAGCVALQALPQEGICEMKRLYVRPAYRARGYGDVLVKLILEDAAFRGYNKMVLDTLERLQPAIRLYRRFGFIDTAPYYDNPLTGVVYMQKQL